MALRLLLALVLILALAWLLKRVRAARRSQRSVRPRAVEGDLVQCAQCRLYVSREAAVRGSDGSFYCSPAHQRSQGPR